MAVGIAFPSTHPIHSQVRAYNEERERQMRELEKTTGGYIADEKDYFARGGKPLITFKDWLKSNKMSTAEQAARSAPVSREVYTPDASAWGSDDDVPAWAREALRRGMNRRHRWLIRV